MLSAIPVALFAVAMGVGFYRGFTRASSYTATEQAIPEDRMVTTEDGSLRLRFPGHWKRMTDLNDGATLQCGNPFREEYLIVLSDLKSDFAGTLAQHAEMTTFNILSAIEDASISSPAHMEINGMPAVQHVITGTVSNIKLVYLHTTIEGSRAIHQVLSWTLQSKREAAFEVYDQVLQTVEEAEPSAEEADDSERDKVVA